MLSHEIIAWPNLITRTQFNLARSIGEENREGWLGITNVSVRLRDRRILQPRHSFKSSEETHQLVIPYRLEISFHPVGSFAVLGQIWRDWHSAE